MMTNRAVPERLLSNSPEQSTWPSKTWSPAMSTATCQQGHWQDWLNGSAESLPRPRHGTDWSMPTSGVGHDSVFIQQSQRLASGPYGPDEIWHVDTTLIRLLDGSKSYLHAVIDNFSRRVLAWRVNDTFIPAVTAELLVEAGREIEDTKPQLLVDGGVENFNSAVDKLVDSGLLKRILAQTEIRYSNSLIESWWRVIKHQWLFLNTLDTVASVRKLVAFYVEQHNSHLPHSAFKGQTPDEMYFGTGDGIPKKLEEEKLQARELRLKTNRERNCHVCLQSASASC